MTKRKLDCAQAENEIENVAACCFLPAVQKALNGPYSYRLTADELAMQVLQELARTNASFRSHDENDKGIQMGLVEARKEVTDGLRRLAKLGFGRFIVGRRGAPTRLQLTRDGRDSLRSHWKIEDEPDAPPLRASESLRVATPVDEDAEQANNMAIAHQFVLRPELVVRLTLPSNLSTSEASRLARFVESLPFTEATTTPR